MKLYAIRDWNMIFENNRSRDLKSLDWVPMPNNHDGENFAAIMRHKKGAIIFAGWVLIVEVASRCDPRGTLLRGCKTPHTSATLALKTRAPEHWFKIALDFLEHSTDWLVVTEFAANPALGCDNPAPSCGNPALGCLEGKGREGNRKEGNTDMSGKPDECVSIYELYPRREGRKKALESIRKAIKEHGLEPVREATERFGLAWSGATKAEMRYCPMPTTWFNQGRYLDSPALWGPQRDGKSPPKSIIEKDVDKMLAEVEREIE